MVYRYYVEGKCEKKLIGEFKTSNRDSKFQPGKLYVFNVLCQEFSVNDLRDITDSTVVVFVYDTDNIDQDKKDRLLRNIKIVSSVKRVKAIIHVQSVNNFEDEVLYCSSAKTIDSIFNTQGSEAFKKAFINCTNIKSKLKTINFNFDKLWTRKPSDKFYAKYTNDSKKIKK